MDQPALYQIRVQGHLSDRWATCFGNLKIENQPNGEAVLSGPLADQAALHGVLARIRELGLPVLQLEQAPTTDDIRHNHNQNKCTNSSISVHTKPDRTSRLQRKQHNKFHRNSIRF